MQILLPKEIGDGRLDTLLYVFKKLRTPQRKGAILRLNWTRVENILPAGVGILACLFDAISEQKAKVKHVFIKKWIRKEPIVQKLIQLSTPRLLAPPNFLDQITDGNILKGVGPSLDISFPDFALEYFGDGLSEDSRFSAKLILNELMINAVDHATSDRYYLYAGVWKKEFHTGVLDMGVSIPAKLEQKYSFDGDLHALRMSLEEGITTRRSRIGGLGLFHTMTCLKENQGRLTIVSRNAQLRKYFQRRKTDATPLKHTLAGTWCFTRFRCN